MTQYQKQVQKIVAYLAKELYLHEWHITSRFVPQTEMADENTAAQINTNGNYFDAVILLGPIVENLYKTGKFRDVAEIVLHELCHIHTDPLYKIASDAVAEVAQKHLDTIREQQTQRMTNILIGYIPREVYTPEKHRIVKSGKKRKNGRKATR